MSNNDITFLNNDIDIRNKIESFFSSISGLAELFINLWNYSKEVEPTVVLRCQNNIIGVSYEDSFYCFYISKNESSYYIKFREQTDKMLFVADSFEEFKKLAKIVIPAIKDNPNYRLQPQDSRKISKKSVKKQELYSADQQKMKLLNEIFSKVDEKSYMPGWGEMMTRCNSHFEKHDSYPISELLFGRRAVSALIRAEIATYGDLGKQDTISLSKVKDLGRKSMYNLLRGCECIASASIDVISLAYEIEQNTADKEQIIPGNSFYQQVHPWEEIYQKVAHILQKDNVLGYEEGFLREFLQNSGHFPAKEIMEVLREIAYFFRKLILNPTYLREQNGDILYRRVIERHTLKQIGDTYGISRERVRQLEKKAQGAFLGRMRRGNLNEEDQEKWKSLILSIPDGSFLTYMYYMSIFYEKIWVYVHVMLGNEAVCEMIVNYIEILRKEYSLRKADYWITQRELPAVLNSLNEAGLYTTTIIVGKEYTAYYGKKIWSSSLFEAISEAYRHLGHDDVAAKFDDLARRVSGSE